MARRYKDRPDTFRTDLVYLTGLTPKEMKTELDEVHGKSAPVFATVYNWVNEFKDDHTSTKDEHRSGLPVEMTTPEMIDKIHDMVLSDRRIKVREIVEATGVSQGTVFSILHEKLDVKKSLQDGCRVCSQWRIKAIVWSTLKLFWRFSVAILTRFCVDT